MIVIYILYITSKSFYITKKKKKGDVICAILPLSLVKFSSKSNKSKIEKENKMAPVINRPYP